MAIDREARQRQINEAIKKYREEAAERRKAKAKSSNVVTREDQDNGQTQSYNIPKDRNVKVIKDTRGNVIGYEDPIAQTSVMFNEGGIRETDIRRAEQQRYSKVVEAERQVNLEKQKQNEEFKRFRQGTITAATEQEKKAIATQKNPILREVKGITSSFVRGFRGESFNPQQETGGELSIFGAQAGLIVRAGTEAAVVTTGIKGAQAGSKALNTALTKAQVNPVLTFGANVAGATATGYGVFKGSKEVEKRLNTIGLGQLDTKTQEASKKAFTAGRQAEAQAQTNIAQRIGFSIGARGNKEVFEKAAVRSLEEQGITGGNLDKALTRLEGERRATQTATLYGNLAVGAFSERSGSIAVNEGLKLRQVGKEGAKEFLKDFGFFSSRIAPAGFGEGFAGEIIAQESLGDQRGFFETAPTTLKLPVPKYLLDKNPNLAQGVTFQSSRALEATFSGAFGAATAGTLGGAIGAYGVRKSVVRRGLLETAGNILDPTEKPSDILEDVIGSPQGRRVRVATLTPSATFTPTNTPTNLFSTTPSQTRTQSLNIVPTPTDIQNFIGQPSQTPSRTPNNILNIVSDVPTPTDTFNPVPLPVDTPVNVPSNVPTNINVNIPVFTDKINASPPFPPYIDFKSGGYAGAGRKAKVGFLDELDASTAIFRSSLLGTQRKAQKPKEKQPKYIIRGNKAYKVAGSETKKAQPQNNNNGFAGFSKRAFG